MYRRCQHQALEQKQSLLRRYAALGAHLRLRRLIACSALLIPRLGVIVKRSGMVTYHTRAAPADNDASKQIKLAHHVQRAIGYSVSNARQNVVLEICKVWEGATADT